MINMENDIVNLLNAISLDLALKWTKKVEWKWHWLRKYVKYLQLHPSPLLPWGSISVEPLKKSGRIDSVLRMIQPTALPCPTNALRFGCWLECIIYHFALSNDFHKVWWAKSAHFCWLWVHARLTDLPSSEWILGFGVLDPLPNQPFKLYLL